ncbi:hypothetical protein B0O99DRAFT_526536 [Bisporella sp. PMI_857]|nr:hypothetical protein B0O99DRAFT_526536 [Bisporella sp. PMI_857]
MTDYITPVKGIVKALETGTKLAKRVSRSTASNSELHASTIFESARALQESLAESAKDISDAYAQLLGSCGDRFALGLTEDQAIQQKFKDLRIDLIDHINECQDYDDDDLGSFNRAAFTALEQRSHECAIVCLEIFNRVRDRLLQDNLQNFKLDKTEARGDESQPSHIRQLNFTRKPVPFSGPPRSNISAAPTEVNQSVPSVGPPPFEPVKPPSAWIIESPTHSALGSPASSSLGTSPRRGSRDISPSSRPDGLVSREIRHQREVVKFRVAANEEFLEKRRQSRLLFQNELRMSISSIDEHRASDIFSEVSVISPLYDGSRSPVSPINGYESRASGNGYEILMERERSLGHASQTSAGSRGSRTSSIIQDNLHRSDSQASQESIFGLRSPPLSPPLSTHRTSATGNLATTLKLPGFGKGVEPGIEVVDRINHDSGLILANESQQTGQPTPTASMKSADHPMRHDSSFYRFGGFCEGAKQILRGEAGFKPVNRPLGHYSSVQHAKCLKCSYEINWERLVKDNRPDSTGVHDNHGIRWREKFLSKSHAKSSSMDEPMFACIFCVEERKTVEEHDATIFFSTDSLFRHLAKHSQPLPNIAGITILYGSQLPHIIYHDYDIHFTTSESRAMPYSIDKISSRVANRPSAHATKTHYFKATDTKHHDPDGNPTLNFAAGARIIGITFPDRFSGQWCVGYHDGDRGAFPASAVTLELPLRENDLMNAQSSLVAYAKWEFKPKDAKDGGWLKFSKGERISAIGYAYQDQWCWSGQTSKGKWGLFPRAFVHNLQEISPPTDSGPPSRGLGLRIGSIPLGRKKSSRRERSGSVVSSGSGSGSLHRGQPGLELVSSLTRSPSSWR